MDLPSEWVCRWEEPEVQLASLVGVTGDGQKASVRFANIKVHIGQSRAVDAEACIQSERVEWRTDVNRYVRVVFAFCGIKVGPGRWYECVEVVAVGFAELAELPVLPDAAEAEVFADEEAEPLVLATEAVDLTELEAEADLEVDAVTVVFAALVEVVGAAVDTVAVSLGSCP